MKHKYLILLFIICLVIVSKSFSQNNPDSIIHPKPNRLSGFKIDLGISYNQIDPSSLTSINNALTSNGYAAAPNTIISWDLSLLNILMKNSILEGDLNFTTTNNNTSGDSRTMLSGFYFKAAYSYIFAHGNHLAFYPSVGIDLGSMDVHSHLQTPTAINDVEGSINFTAFDFSLNLDKFSHILPDNSAWDGMEPVIGKLFNSNIGISIGCCLNPFKAYWDDSNIDVYNKTSPNVNFVTNVIGLNNIAPISFYYVKLRFGIGSAWKK